VESRVSEVQSILNDKGTSGVYTFPSVDARHSDHVFGPVLIKAERKPLVEIQDPFLKEGWGSDVEDSPLENVRGVQWTYTVPDESLTDRRYSAEQVWGYADIEIPGAGKQRRYVRKVHFVSPTLTKNVLLVYDHADGAPIAVAETPEEEEEEEDLTSFGTS
jgi:hypothetical protein